MLWWWGYTEPVSPRPPRLHRISTHHDGPPFFGLTVANGALRTLLDLQLAPAQSRLTRTGQAACHVRCSRTRTRQWRRNDQAEDIALYTPLSNWA